MRHRSLGILIVFLCFLCACTPPHNGPLAYVSNERDGTITIIDIETDRVISTIKVGGRPRGLRLGRDGKTVWVAVSYPSNQSTRKDQISVIDAGSGNAINGFEVGTDPEEFVISR
jgi:YVTN family beta-propeller protein